MMLLGYSDKTSPAPKETNLITPEQKTVTTSGGIKQEEQYSGMFAEMDSEESDHEQ